MIGMRQKVATRRPWRGSGAAPSSARCLIALTALVSALALLAGGSGQAQAGLQVPQGAVELEQEVFEIGRKLRCPTCVSEAVADSDAGISIEMRTIIREQLREGKSEAEILAFFQERYGDWILLEPPRRGVHLIVWILPVIAAVTGATLLITFVRRWTQAAGAPVSATDEDLERVRRQLKELQEPHSNA